MRTKRILAIFLLGVSLCFMPALGYGEIERWRLETKATLMDIILLKLEISFIMSNPDNFLYVTFFYDQYGEHGRIAKLPKGVDTKGKIYVQIIDNRGVFSDKSGITLLNQFKSDLKGIYSYLQTIATDMNIDIVAEFYSRKGIPLGYFYQGEYHLWGNK